MLKFLPFAFGAVLLIYVFVLIIALIPKIFYILTLQKTFKNISFENQRMEPNNTWLLLIPVFGLVWHFIVLNRLFDALYAEKTSKGIDFQNLKQNKQLGLAVCILACCMFVPGVRTVAFMGYLVCWIIFWIKVNDYLFLLKKRNMASGAAVS